MSREFGRLYSRDGRPSIPPERLLRALLLQAFYTVRSERQLMEQLDYNLLFRWFVGLSMDDAVWNPTVFCKNRDRLLDGDIAAKFFVAVLNLPQVRGLLSNEHFSVDGTLIEAWASMKSFVPKDRDDPPAGKGGSSRNAERDFHGEKRKNATHSSTTDPDAVPHWGNRLDVHVQLSPGRPYDGTARFTIVGGVAAASVDVGTGLTLPGAAIAENGNPLPDDCPFAGVVTLHGPLDPSLAGQLYRIRVRNLTTGGPVSDLTDAFYVVNWLGVGSWATPGAGGWTPWPSWVGNTTGKLGHFTPGGDDLWEVQLEVLGLGVVDVRRVQMDNTLNASIVIGDPDDGADLQLSTLGACRIPRGWLNGTFVARDKHFWSWSIGVIGGPTSSVPPTPLVVGIGATTQTPVSGEAFSINLSALQPCGYVVQLGVTDRAVVSSAWVGRTVYVNRGVCLE